MVIAAQLESQLQTARLGSLLPILLELGVERTEDLDHIEDSDIEKRNDITVIHKRRFLEWKANVLEVGSTVSDDNSTVITQIATQAQRMARQSETSDGSRPDRPSDSSRPSGRFSSDCPQPRTGQISSDSSQHQVINKILLPQDGSPPIIQASPFVTGRPACMPQCGPFATARPSSDRAMPLPSQRDHPFATARPNYGGTSMPNQTPRTRVGPLMQVLRELEALDQALQDERHRCKTLQDDLEEERRLSAQIVEEKKANEEGHTRDMAVLEEMLQHLMNENAALKQAAAQHEATGQVPRTADLASEVLAQCRQVQEIPRTADLASVEGYDSSSRYTQQPMGAAYMAAAAADGYSSNRVTQLATAMDVSTADLAATRNTECCYEPDMEPRSTMADRLSQIQPGFM